MKAKLYDKMMKTLEDMRLTSERKKLLENRHGSIAEFGAGTGINFQFYLPMDRVVAIEPDHHMADEARKKIGDKNITIVSSGAEALPFEDDSFDTVVITLALCTIPDPEAALREARRICTPHGSLLIMEHVRNKNNFLASLQDILTPLWKSFAMGCHLNRDTLSLIEEVGFKKISSSYFWGNNFVSAVYKNTK